MNNRGVTLIALVVTIIVMLILAGVSISSVLNVGTVDITKEVAFKSEAKDIKDAWETKIIGVDSTFLEYADVSDILSGLNANPTLLDKLEIQNGNLVYKDEYCTNQEKEWFEAVDIFGGIFIEANVKTNVRVLGEIKKEQRKQGADIVVAVDMSGSMTRVYYRNRELPRRIGMVGTLINNLATQISKNDVKNRFGIVGFGGDAVVDYNRYCSGRYTSMILPLNNYSYSGNWMEGNAYTSTYGYIGGQYVKIEAINYTGTYIQGGLYKAYQLLRDRTDKTNLPVIFLLTDGVPNDNYYNVGNSLTDAIINSPSHHNQWSNKGDNAKGLAYNTIKTAALIKKELPKSMIYTINMANQESELDEKYVKLLLNPCDSTINDAKTYNSSVRGKQGEIDGMTSSQLNAVARKVEELSSQFGKNYYYADNYSIGALSAQEFEKLFAQFIQEIEINLEKEYEVDHNPEVTGVYSVDSDSLSVTLPDGTHIDFIVAEEELDGSPGIVKIKVKAAAYTPSSAGNPPTKVNNSEKTIEKTITFQEIKDGVDPNLYYLNGMIKWNVRSEYKNSSGMAEEALQAVRDTLTGNQVAAIEEVVLEIPVNIKDNK